MIRDAIPLFIAVFLAILAGGAVVNAIWAADAPAAPLRAVLAAPEGLARPV